MLKAILVDDELNNIDNLSFLLGAHCRQQVKVAGTAANAGDARALIISLAPDLVFLDIQMPRENGFQLLQSFPEINFGVIFVTAYDQYGIQAIKMSALDYLLKPINVEDLKQAVNKAEQQQYRKQHQRSIEHLLSQIGGDRNTKPAKLALSTGAETRLVNIADIIRCESSNSYTTFFLTGNEKIMVCRAIKEYEELLGQYGFIRVHQSHLVNIDFIKTILKNDSITLLLTNGKEIPVARQRKQTVFNALKLS